MTDIADLRDALLANFRTVHIRSSDAWPEADDWWATAKAFRAEKRGAQSYRDRMRRLLVDRGHAPFLDYLEADPDGGWRLHLFVLDKAALALLGEHTDGECGPGAPVSFDAEEFVSEHVGQLMPQDSHSE
jgi:hypothetical protein